MTKARIGRGRANVVCALVCGMSFCGQANAQTGIITTIAGDSNGGYSGDGGPATAAQMSGPSGLAMDGAGNLYIADTGNNAIRKVTPAGIITTYAGNGNAGFSGDGGPATSASLNIDIDPGGIAVDAAGNLYIADSLNNRVRKVAPGGIITTVAGNGFGSQDGIGGFSGDGGPATSAELFAPVAVAVDASGNLYIADLANMRVRKVSPGGIITTVAGSGCTLTISTPNCGGFSGDGGPATSATLNRPAALAVDSTGNLYIADNENNRIRKVSTAGIITTVAGIGPVCPFSSDTCTGSYSGDGGPATSAALNFPEGLTVDSSGNLYIGDTGNLRVREVSASGIITTIAGDGQFDHNIFDPAGDGGPATSAELNLPEGVVLDAAGNIYISDNLRSRVRKVSGPASSAPLLTVSPANLSFSLFAGGSSSQQISLTGSTGVAWSATGSSNWITLTPSSGTGPGTISAAVNAASLQPGTYTASITISNPSASPSQETVSVSLTVTAGMLSVTPAALSFLSQQGGPAQSQSVQLGGTAGVPWQATVATSTGGWLSVLPGTGQIPASLTASVNPAGLAIGTYQGTITVQAPLATPSSGAIGVSLTVSAAAGPGGIISTVAGDGNCCFSGDGGQATSASMGSPFGIALDAAGNLYISDISNRVRKVSPGGIISTVAGNGTQGFSGDGGPATSASLNTPYGLAADSSGNLYISDLANNRIRKVTPDGTITTIAGIGPSCPASGPPCGGFSGDGGKATLASLNNPRGIALDASGNLFIADDDNSRIRKVSPSGIITTVAGDGNTFTCTPASCSPFHGDGGPATSAGLSFPEGVAVDASGNLFIADTVNERVRKVSASGIITTVAGNGAQSSSGDGGAAVSAALQPYSVAVDGVGNLFIADYADNVVRRVSTSGIITTFAGNGKSGFSGDGGPAASASINAASVALDASGNLFIADFANGRVREVMGAGSPVLPAPVVSGLSPNSATAGGAAFILTVSGTGFSNGSTIEWNSSSVPTNYVGATQLTASISANLIAASGSASVAVVDSTAGTSNAVVFTINPAPPVISGLSPNFATAGGAAFKLTVNGSGFTSGSNVEWNGAAVATSYVSATQLTASIPASLIAAPGGASVSVLNPAAGMSSAVTFVVFSASPNLQTISHIADGSGWRSSIVLVNTDTVPAFYAVNFWNDAGASYSPSLALGAATGSILVGGSTIIETADTASALTTGWAEVTSNQALGGTAIFRYDPWSQEAAVPLLTSGGVKLEIPYQVGSGLSLGVALANPSATQSASLTEVIRGQNGNQLASRTLTLPALNHASFNPAFPSSVAGGGVVEYDSNVNVFGLGIRSAPEGSALAFTSLDAVLPTAASTKTISHIADGGGWRSSIILVNTDTVPASYTVSFRNDAGGSYTPPLALGAASGIIPVGGSTIIETADTASALTTGWAQVTSSQSLGGTAIFRYDPWSQEAAVPLLTSGGLKLEIPYQAGSGLSLGVALANPSATQTANITEVIRDQNGNQLSSRTFTLAALNHTSFNPTFPSTIVGGGVVEYDSNVNLFGLGIRSAPEGSALAFTSVRAAYK